MHFGAIDYFSTIYVNGQKCGTHKGGYVSFSIDITEYLTVGKNIITINATDDTRSRLVPTGKQSDQYHATITIFAELCGSGRLTAKATYKGKEMGENSVVSNGGTTVITLSLSELHLWEVGNGRLYDLILTYGEDKVTSYFGLRCIQLTDKNS